MRQITTIILSGFVVVCRGSLDQSCADPFAPVDTPPGKPMQTETGKPNIKSEFEDEYLKANTDSLGLAKEVVLPEMLNAFDELPIGDKKLLDVDNPSWRLFINNSGETPVLIKVHAYVERPWRIAVKRINRKNEQWVKRDEFEFTLTNKQQELLDAMLNESRFYYITCSNYPDVVRAMGGETWIYEIPVPGSFRIIARPDRFLPMDDRIFPLFEMSHKRYACENSLRTMTMMLWMLAETGN